MSNKVYDVLKWLVILVLPALSTCISGLFLVWNIPYGEEISKTIMLIDAFLGACLGISSLNYNSKKDTEIEWLDLSNDNVDNDTDVPEE